jgi:NADP-dependent aldehyde dehydrogenase
LSLVHGREAGAHVVRHPAVTAVGFTGSLVGGRALMRIIDERLSPIPFYGELGSVNPLVVTPAAARERGEEIGRGFAQSFTLGMGQFCTKPGIAFVPIGQAGDGVVEAAAAQTEETLAGPLLNTHISKAFDEGVERLSAADSVRLRAVGVTGEPASRAAIPRLLEVDSDELTDQMLDEYFGPVALVVRYADEGGLLRSIGRLPASLTATIHRGSAEKVAASIRRALEAGAGRMIYDGYPTGVAVSWAQNHGGGWPASNSLHTSVGATAVRRFMRPLVWQDAPADVLPVELRDDMREIPRRVNGVMRSKDA